MQSRNCTWICWILATLCVGNRLGQIWVEDEKTIEMMITKHELSYRAECLVRFWSINKGKFFDLCVSNVCLRQISLYKIYA